MVGAEGAAAAGEGVGGKGTGLLVLPEMGQINREPVRSCECVGVVFSEGPASGVQELLVELAAALVLATGRLPAGPPVARETAEEERDPHGEGVVGFGMAVGAGGDKDVRGQLLPPRQGFRVVQDTVRGAR